MSQEFDLEPVFVPMQIKTVWFTSDAIMTPHKQREKNTKGTEVKPKEVVRRVEAAKWTFDPIFLQTDSQLQLVREIGLKVRDSLWNGPATIALQQIRKKISGYRQQDMTKHMYDPIRFITIDSVLDKMLSTELKCHYCLNIMNVLYDISREMVQWTVDRIDNSQGHNLDNYYLACLGCNLKRRCRNDEKFLFTKQLRIAKQPREEAQPLDCL